MVIVDVPIPATPNHIFELTLPDGAEILGVSPFVGKQASPIHVPGVKSQTMLVLSVMIDEKAAPKNAHRFAIVGTGNEFRWADGSRYLGTVIVPMDETVSVGLHVFELPRSLSMAEQFVEEKKKN